MSFPQIKGLSNLQWKNIFESCSNCWDRHRVLDEVAVLQFPGLLSTHTNSSKVVLWGKIHFKTWLRLFQSYLLATFPLYLVTIHPLAYFWNACGMSKSLLNSRLFLGKAFPQSGLGNSLSLETGRLCKVYTDLGQLEHTRDHPDPLGFLVWIFYPLRQQDHMKRPRTEGQQ